VSRVKRRRTRPSSLRSPDHDYSRAGAYFVTFVVRGRAAVLSHVNERILELTEAGRLVASSWTSVVDRTPGVALDSLVIMPDHVHAIVLLRRAGTVHVGRVVGAVKGLSAWRIHQLWSRSTGPFWERGYHDSMVRDEEHLERLRRYIHENPARWSRAHGLGAAQCPRQRAHVQDSANGGSPCI
jgi:putative transposase